MPVNDDPLWYKDAIIYEVHVRTFHDSDGDGVGDFPGLTAKLPYLQDLGVTAVWLLPFCPSPLKDEGYDIADYKGVHPLYGTLRDFRIFLREAHRRGIRVISELVVNHTSDQHPWFQRSRRAKPGSLWRRFYVWSDSRERYKDARIIFKDFESSNWTWDPVANAYYWHRFYAHQPDLNYESGAVRKAVLRVLDFWFGMGVDGVRLDAVPYLFERDGTSCENLPETHAFLKELRRHVDAKFKNRLFLAEANQWPEDAVAYFGSGDECHMNFHFPLMPRLFMAMRMEDRFPVIDILQQTPAIPESCQWALFLRNHDELTLEMVTEDERDYMYRAYARDPQARLNLGIRRRLAPLLGNDRKKMELMNGLLFSLPGTPVLYFGDEIGMGDNIYLGDRNAVRSPMQWSTDRNAGFSRANPQKLYLPLIIDPEYHYESVNVENEQNNPHSLLWWTKRLISLRKRYRAFGRGSLEILQPANRKVLALVRTWNDESLLVVANLSRFAQHVALDLSAFRGREPLELFGQTRFPPIDEAPYRLTLAGHTFYWFALDRQAAEAPVGITRREAELPALVLSAPWESVLVRDEKTRLEAILPDVLRTRRWFSGRDRTIHFCEIQDAIPIPHDKPVGWIAVIRVIYREGEPDTYLLPVTCALGKDAAEVPAVAAIARVRVNAGDEDADGVLYDALWSKAFAQALFGIIARGRRFSHDSREVAASPSAAFRPLLSSAGDFLEPAVVKTEQNNTSVVYGDLFILKLFRRIDEGPNPELDLGRFLTEKRDFPNIAPLASALEYRDRTRPPTTLAVLHSYLPNEGDAWHYTLDGLGRYFEDVLARRQEQPTVTLPTEPLLALAEGEIPELAEELIGSYFEAIRLLGRRTGELHLALAADAEDASFAPEPFTDFYRRGLYQGMLSLLGQTFPLLRERLKRLPEPVRAEAEGVLALDGEIRKRFQSIRDRRLSGLRTRCHGDYHLGQVLYTGKDFVIVDFEGEADRPASIRRLKRSPLHDVATMLRSFDYAAYAALFGHVATLRPEDFSAMEPWARYWQAWVSAVYLKAYLASVGAAPLLPNARNDLEVLLDVYLLEKAIHELRHEMLNRPDWMRIPLYGIRNLVAGSATAR